MNTPNGLANGRGASGDSLGRYRAALEQARGGSALGQNGGASNLRTRTDYGTLGDRSRGRTQASTSGPTAGLRRTAGAGATATTTTGDTTRLRRTADGTTTTGGDARRRLGSTAGGTEGAFSDRMRLRRDGGGSVGTDAAGTTAARRGLSTSDGGTVDPSRTFGSRSRTRSGVTTEGVNGGTRVITTGEGHSDGYSHRSLHDSHHDGHHHDSYHDHGHVHNHHDGGWFVSWGWGGWHYGLYGGFWLGGLPAFGYGVSYYDPYYAPYFDPGVVVVERPYPYVVEQPYPYYGGPPVVAPEAVPVAPVAPAPVAPATTETPLPSADEGDAAKQAFETGIRAFSEQRYQQAAGMFRLVTQLDPKNGEAWLGLAHASLAGGQYADAAGAVATAADLGAFPRGYRFDPRPVYKVEGAFDATMTRLQAYAKGNPQDADAHLLLAWLHVGLNDHDKAKANLAELKALRADDPTAAFLRAAMLPPEPPARAQGTPAPEGAPVRPPAAGETPEVLPPPPTEEVVPPR